MSDLIKHEADSLKRDLKAMTMEVQTSIIHLYIYLLLLL